MVYSAELLLKVIYIIENYDTITKNLIENELDISELIKYYVFFKRHVINCEITYNEEMIPNISKLFKKIREINVL